MQNTEVLEYIKQAFELKEQKCYKQAIEMLYKALELENDNVEILFQLGELYFLLKNFPRATHYLNKVLEKDSDHLDALKIIEKIYIYTNEFQKAYEYAMKVFDNQNNSENLFNVIEILAKQGDLNKISELESSKWADTKVLYGIAKAFYDNKQFDKAKEKLEKALNLNPENEAALVLLGKIYFDEDDFEKSKNIFLTFPKTTENPEVLNYLGLFALEEMKFTDAIKYFSKASNSDKQNHTYFYNLANAYFYNGWFNEAKKCYLNAICIAPDVVGYRYSLAYLYYEEKDFEKAKKEIDYILEHNPEYGPAHVINALLKFENKDFLGAKNELETNIKNGNNDIFTLIAISKVYKELGLYEKAEAILQEVINKNPDSLNYQCKLAEVYIEKKQFDKAIDIIEKVLKSNENYIIAYTLAAKAYYLKNNFEKTKYYAQQSISLDMNFAPGYYYLALVRFFEKDYDEAIECMKRAIMYDINNPEYYAKMSEIYKEKQDYKSALEYIKEAESISEKTEYRILYKEIASLYRKVK